MMKSLFSGIPTIEVRHEYMRNAYQRESALYQMGKIQWWQMADKLKEIYDPATHYSPAEIFLDASWHLAWCINILTEIYPDSKIVHLVRDGRRVAASFFYKLNIFDERSRDILRKWMDGETHIIPPRDEKFWQILPPTGFDTFQTICWHWKLSNYSIMRSLDYLPENRKLFIRLEDISSSEGELTRLLNFVGVKYDPSFMEAMQKPKHVYVPINYQLTEEQQKQFAEICGSMMEKLGYSMDEGEKFVHYQM
jgi:hypothetical protein